VTPLEEQEIAWVEPGGLHHYEMPPADEPLKTSLPPLLRALGVPVGKEDD
jgi:hypothetical protein